MRVLVVESSDAVMDRLGALLSAVQDVGLIAYAHNPQEGRAAFERVQPDVILVDAHLPCGGSLDFLRYLRKAPGSVSIIALTGDQVEGYDGRLRAAGAHLVLQKAAQVQSLEDVVAGLARGKAGRVPAEGRPRPGGRPVAERAR